MPRQLSQPLFLRKTQTISISQPSRSTETQVIKTAPLILRKNLTRTLPLVGSLSTHRAWCNTSGYWMPEAGRADVPDHNCTYNPMLTWQILLKGLTSCCKTTVMAWLKLPCASKSVYHVAYTIYSIPYAIYSIPEYLHTCMHIYIYYFKEQKTSTGSRAWRGEKHRRQSF